MSDQFDKIINDVRTKYSELIRSVKHKITDLPMDMPTRGIYLFSEGESALYAGRTNSLRCRLQCHARNNHNQATFAFLLARHKTDNLKASYKQKGSRKELLKNPRFKIAFDSARERIRLMDVQFIEELYPIRQSILEVYVAVESGAKYNNFDNH